MGIKMMMNSKNDVIASADYTYGYIAGFDSPTSLKGKFDDWITAKGPTETALVTAPTVITTPAQAAAAFGFARWNNGEPIWLAVPIARAGFRTFSVHLTSGLNQDLNVSAWLIPEVGDPNSFLQGTGSNLGTASGLFADKIVTAEVLQKGNASSLVFGPGGVDPLAFRGTTAGWLLIKFERTTVPSSGNIRIGISRQK